MSYGKEHALGVFSIAVIALLPACAGTMLRPAELNGPGVEQHPLELDVGPLGAGRISTADLEATEVKGDDGLFGITLQRKAPTEEYGDLKINRVETSFVYRFGPVGGAQRGIRCDAAALASKEEEFLGDNYASVRTLTCGLFDGEQQVGSLAIEPIKDALTPSERETLSGTVSLGERELSFTSETRAEGSSVRYPRLGYIFTAGGTPVAAVQLRGETKGIWFTPALDPDSRAAVMATTAALVKFGTVKAETPE